MPYYPSLSWLKKQLLKLGVQEGGGGGSVINTATANGTVTAGDLLQFDAGGTVSNARIAVAGSGENIQSVGSAELAVDIDTTSFNPATTMVRKISGDRVVAVGARLNQGGMLVNIGTVGNGTVSWGGQFQAGVITSAFPMDVIEFDNDYIVIPYLYITVSNQLYFIVIQISGTTPLVIKSFGAYNTSGNFSCRMSCFARYPGTNIILSARSADISETGRLFNSFTINFNGDLTTITPGAVQKLTPSYNITNRSYNATYQARTMSFTHISGDNFLMTESVNEASKRKAQRIVFNGSTFSLSTWSNLPTDGTGTTADCGCVKIGSTDWVVSLICESSAGATSPETGFTTYYMLEFVNGGGTTPLGQNPSFNSYPVPVPASMASPSSSYVPFKNGIVRVSEGVYAVIYVITSLYQTSRNEPLYMSVFTFDETTLTFGSWTEFSPGVYSQVISPTALNHYSGTTYSYMETRYSIDAVSGGRVVMAFGDSTFSNKIVNTVAQFGNSSYLDTTKVEAFANTGGTNGQSIEYALPSEIGTNGALTSGVEYYAPLSGASSALVTDASQFFVGTANPDGDLVVEFPKDDINVVLNSFAQIEGGGAELTTIEPVGGAQAGRLLGIVDDVIQHITDTNGMEVLTRLNARFLGGYGATPTVATVTAGAGTGSSATVTGTSLAGVVSLTTGTGTASGEVVTVTYPVDLPSSPYVILTAGDSGIGTPYSSSVGTNSFRIAVDSALATSTTFKFNYTVIL